MASAIDRELAQALLQDSGWQLEALEEFNPHGAHAFYLNDIRHQWEGLFTISIESFDALPRKDPAILAKAVEDLADAMRTGTPGEASTQVLYQAVAVYAKSTQGYQAWRSTADSARFHCIINLYPASSGAATRLFFAPSALTVLSRDDVKQMGAEVEAYDRARNPGFFLL